MEDTYTSRQRNGNKSRLSFNYLLNFTVVRHVLPIFTCKNIPHTVLKSYKKAPFSRKTTLPSTQLLHHHHLEQEIRDLSKDNIRYFEYTASTTQTKPLHCACQYFFPLSLLPEKLNSPILIFVCVRKQANCMLSSPKIQFSRIMSLECA